MTKTKITFETKKNTTAETLWAIRRDRVYPDIEAGCGRLKWRNAGGILPDYNNDAPGLGDSYTCDLLRSDTEGHDIHTRESHAGYIRTAYGKPNEPPAPGTFSLRGVDLGEMCIKFEANREWPSIRVRGFYHPTPSEADFIKREIVPHLLAAIEANRAELKAEAFTAIREGVKTQLDEARKGLDAMACEMEAALLKAEAKK